MQLSLRSVQAQGTAATIRLHALLSNHPIHEDGWLAVALCAIYAHILPTRQGSDYYVILLDPSTAGLPTIGHVMVYQRADHLLQLIGDVALQMWIQIIQAQHLRVSRPTSANMEADAATVTGVGDISVHCER